MTNFTIDSEDTFSSQSSQEQIKFSKLNQILKVERKLIF